MNYTAACLENVSYHKRLMLVLQDVDETPDFTEDSDTNPNTTASSIAGDHLNADGRKRRSEATQLRRSVFGKKHDRLGESKVSRILTHFL
jgi:SWI/SNF-related matrix-associated actin-dependent regulator of chromatin subfamily A member 5